MDVCDGVDDEGVGEVYVFGVRDGSASAAKRKGVDVENDVEVGLSVLCGKKKFKVIDVMLEEFVVKVLVVLEVLARSESASTSECVESATAMDVL